MNIWKEYIFSEAIEIAPTVSLKGSESYSYVEMKDLSDGRKYCYPSAERQLSSGARFQNGDTLFARITPCLENGKICQVAGLKGGVGFGSTEFLVFRGKEGITDNDYVFYLSRSEEVRSFAEQNFDGTSGRQRVPKTAFDNLKVFLPSLPEQKAIAGVLSSLDDKIDLLRRQNKTLEGMAEALWQKMFVENADSKWEVDVLGNLFDIGIGRTPPRREQHWFTAITSDVKWASIRDMGNSGVYIDSVSEYLTEEAICKFNIPIIPANTVLLSFKMTIGRLAISTEEMTSNEAIAHFKIKKKSCMISEYLYFFLKTFKYESLGSTSSIVEAINSQMIKEIEMSVPPKEAIAEFRNSIDRYFSKIKVNQCQIRTLSRLRDTLLPKLMSGEVNINTREPHD